MLPFNQLPASLRLPGVYIEIDNSLAAQAEMEFKVLVIGQRLAAGTVAQGVPTRVTNEAQAELFFGRGSMLAEQLKSMKAVDRFMETWAIALDDNGAGVQAAGTVTIGGAPTESGTLNLYIAGKRVQTAITAAQTTTQIATALAAAIAADTSLPVTASAAVAVVTLTARHKGEAGNTLDLRLNYYGETTPAGMTATIVGLTGGTSNPGLATAIAAFGAEWWNWIVMPYTDTANLVLLEAELDSRWGPMKQKGCRAFAAYRGAHAATGTFGSGRNSPHLTVMGTNIVPEPPYIWASVNAIRAANALALDPARPLQSLELTGLKAPVIATRWTDDERNLLLYDGIATYRITSDGRCVIERQITTYQSNSSGISDISYLDINRPETLERVRYEQRARVSLRFPRHKLSSTDERFGAGQPIVTATSIKAELVSLYQDFVELGWCEDLAGYKASIVVEIDTATGRLSWKDEPRLIGQAQTFAGLTQFRI
ncbi:MAG TPA: phage tail sheath subtilisin-like domain-containing protein [Acidiferrobacterales bacterium]|nr:phage tail sheath subtilisin-like domain-containing protein [Acidiferrobacterales bacterium]